jgi:hypothetical protein
MKRENEEVMLEGSKRERDETHAQRADRQTNKEVVKSTILSDERI